MMGFQVSPRHLGSVRHIIPNSENNEGAAIHAAKISSKIWKSVWHGVKANQPYSGIKAVFSVFVIKILILQGVTLKCTQ